LLGGASEQNGAAERPSARDGINHDNTGWPNAAIRRKSTSTERNRSISRYRC
jgi:hypothetical protein